MLADSVFVGASDFEVAVAALPVFGAASLSASALLGVEVPCPGLLVSAMTRGTTRPRAKIHAASTRIPSSLRLTAKNGSDLDPLMLVKTGRTQPEVACRPPRCRPGKKQLVPAAPKI